MAALYIYSWEWNVYGLKLIVLQYIVKWNNTDQYILIYIQVVFLSQISNFLCTLFVFTTKMYQIFIGLAVNTLLFLCPEPIVKTNSVNIIPYMHFGVSTLSV